MSNDHAQYVSKVEQVVTDAGMIVHEIKSASIVQLDADIDAGIPFGKYACISVDLLVPVK